MKLLAGILLLLLAACAQAATEPVILSVHGDIQLHGSQHQKIDFTLKDVQALTQAEITTAHPWSAQARTYNGVDLNALLEQLFGHTQIKRLNLEALNGFSIALDWSEISHFSPILAWQDNGKVMSRRNQGPLWLILPFDQAPSVKQADFLHFMVWQLRVIRVNSEPE